MAAGMGSRYGGLKQLDGVGPSGETIMDYSVFDAARAGFGKVVSNGISAKRYSPSTKDAFRPKWYSNR